MKPVSTVAVLEAPALDDSPPVEQSNNPVAMPEREMFVVAIKDFASLEQYVPAWEDLARSALEPNPFYESWMLIPALQKFGVGKDLQLVLVFAPNRGWPKETPLLCGG